MTVPVPQTDGRIPFLDLARTHAPLADVFAGEFEALLESSTFVNGEQVGTFEVEFAGYCGTRTAVGVASGLDALRLALAASDIEAGGEVIVPAMTFVATWEAVSQVGAVPVPVDITDADYNLDLDAVEAAIGRRTMAIIPVHLYGQMADMEALAGDLRTDRGTTRRRCRAGARRDARRPARRGLGPRRGVQLLSREEPRCDG